MRIFIFVFLFIFPLKSMCFASHFDDEIKKNIQNTLFNYEDEFNSISSESWDLIGFDYKNNNISTFPSMSQAMDLSESLIGITHLGLLNLNYKLFNNKESANNWLILQFVVLDMLFFYLPGGFGWLHEEGHRSILSIHGIHSFNDMNLFPIGDELIYVSEIKDTDLIRLKKESPQDMVRLAAAGMEIEYEASLRYKKRAFFERSNYSIDRFGVYTALELNQFAYLWLNAYGMLDSTSIKYSNSEGDDILERDSVGLDFTSWVYDLHRPYEAYEARGIHPSGNGINRYILTSDLTTEEKEYLKLQANLHVINILFSSSKLILPDRYFFTTKNGNIYQWDFSLSHMLTSFGYSLNMNTFLKRGDFNVLSTLRGYFSRDLVLPGLELELYKYPLKINNYDFHLSTAIALWLQPKNQLFMDDEFSFGAWASLKFEFPLFKYGGVYLETEAKTKGWKSGNEYLSETFVFNSGFQVRL